MSTGVRANLRELPQSWRHSGDGREANRNDSKSLTVGGMDPDLRIGSACGVTQQEATGEIVRSKKMEDDLDLRVFGTAHRSRGVGDRGPALD